MHCTSKWYVLIFVNIDSLIFATLHSCIPSPNCAPRIAKNQIATNKLLNFIYNKVVPWTQKSVIFSVVRISLVSDETIQKCAIAASLCLSSIISFLIFTVAQAKHGYKCNNNVYEQNERNVNRALTLLMEQHGMFKMR